MPGQTLFTRTQLIIESVLDHVTLDSPFNMLWIHNKYETLQFLVFGSTLILMVVFYQIDPGDNKEFDKWIS